MENNSSNKKPRLSEGQQILYQECPTSKLSSESVALSMPEVLLTILDQSKDFQLVKTCRLVSKFWNTVACRYLRKQTVVRLDENESKRLDDFKNVLLDRLFHLDNSSGPEFPSPFKKYVITVTTFANPVFVNFVEKKIGQVVSIFVNQSFNSACPLSSKAFNNFLNQHKDHLTLLSISGRESPSNFPLPVEVQLKQLKEFVFKDYCKNDCHHCEFVHDLLKNCMPSEVKILVNSQHALSKLISEDTLAMFNSLRSIHLDCKAVMLDQDLAPLAKLQPSENLEQMTLLFREESHPIIVDLVSRAAGHLRRFSTFAVPIGTMAKMRYPKLESMFNHLAGDTLSGITTEKFPALQHLQLFCRWDEMPRFVTKDFQVVNTVTELTIKGKIVPKDLLDKRLPALFMKLSPQFPNVTTIKLIMKEFTPKMFMLISQYFPKLKELILDGYCSFSNFTGILEMDMYRYLEFGWDLCDIPRGPPLDSIICMRNLEHLVLTKAFEVTDDLIVCALARLPKLKTLQFYMDPDVSQAIIQSYLGHLILTIDTSGVE